eukprot:scaffold131591_cov36-Tisochrysis_lutea.AAC.2
MVARPPGGGREGAPGRQDWATTTTSSPALSVSRIGPESQSHLRRRRVSDVSALKYLGREKVLSGLQLRDVLASHIRCMSIVFPLFGLVCCLLLWGSGGDAGIVYPPHHLAIPSK